MMKLKNHLASCCFCSWDHSDLTHQPAELFLFQKQIPSKIFLISLFLTVVVCWIKAVDLIQVQCRFLLKSAPLSGLDMPNEKPLASSEPCGCIFTPKTRISIREPLSWGTPLMGKWAHRASPGSGALRRLRPTLLLASDAAKRSPFLCFPPLVQRSPSPCQGDWVPRDVAEVPPRCLWALSFQSRVGIFQVLFLLAGDAAKSGAVFLNYWWFFENFFLIPPSRSVCGF